MLAANRLAPALESLPRVFALSDLKQLLPGEEDQALDVALRWLEAGVIKQVAPPRPVFFKVILGEELDETDRCRALLRAFPSLVMVAGSVLWRQGLSAQRDTLLECCVSEKELNCNLPGVALRWRPPAWWAAVRQAGGIAGDHHGVAMLTPEMALADAAAFRDVWMPDREAVDWNQLSTARLSEATQDSSPMWFAVLASLVSVVLFYLSDRQQRWLDQPLPGLARLLALLLLAAATALWVVSLGVGVGLFVGLWVVTLSTLLLPLMAGHYRDSFQRGPRG